ncbi:hypothetical protein L218DRAFT_1019048 [Marasmius fiardii PR-910]|nr:hypothetical protein L218DRAFT_1019048 [Marasmius fiardii PR-910]
MTHDTDVYPDPESSIPGRFLTEDGRCNDDQMMLPFGFGRMICPGRHLYQTLWVGIASVLSKFDLSQPRDMAGKPINR